jgi:hypothetical protein
MRAQITVSPVIPPGVDSSYGEFHFYKFGVCCWTYGNFRGQVEYINSLLFCSEPKYQGATSFEYWFFPGVQAHVEVIAQVQGLAPQDVVVNGIPRNPVTGKNMPLVVE